jgi:uncharacterized membrane protein YfcA
MRYLVHPADPFAVVNHPLQPLVQHLHIVAAPLLVFAAGAEWHRHAWAYWRQGAMRRRRSGIALLLTLAPMVASGYLIQTAVDGGWRKVWVGVHLAASGLWLAGYLAHQATGYFRLASAQRYSTSSSGPAPPPTNQRTDGRGLSDPSRI